MLLFSSHNLKVLILDYRLFSVLNYNLSYYRNNNYHYELLIRRGEHLKSNFSKQIHQNTDLIDKNGINEC